MEANIVFIEHCVNCSSHLWCTNHKTERYKHYFALCKSMILEKFPHCSVQENSLKTLSLSKSPRIGSFEIVFRNEIIFSKLVIGKWPNLHAVGLKIGKILSKVVGQTQSPKKKTKLLKKKRLITKRKTEKTKPYKLLLSPKAPLSREKEVRISIKSLDFTTEYDQTTQETDYRSSFLSDKTNPPTGNDALNESSIYIEDYDNSFTEEQQNQLSPDNTNYAVMRYKLFPSNIPTSAVCFTQTSLSQLHEGVSQFFHLSESESQSLNSPPLHQDSALHNEYLL